jgi:hypothetical protein
MISKNLAFYPLEVYIRSLLIHGARAVVRRVENKEDSRSRWIQRLVMTRGKNKAAVALANKNARIIWALLRPVQLNLCTRGYLPARHQAALSTNCNGIVCFRTQIP